MECVGPIRIHSSNLRNDIINLISDDVNASYAFLDFSEEISVKPTFISDSRKMFGILVKGSK